MEESIRSRSLIISVLIHGLIFLVLLFTVMKTSIPPFPEAGGSGGVIVNIGYLAEAGGEVQPMSENITTDPSLERVRQTKVEEENYATQDMEESPVTKPAKEEKKNVVKTVSPQVNASNTEKKIAEPVKTVDQRAIYKGKSNDSKSQGTGTGTGDQGDPAGDPNSRYTGKSGSGTGLGQGDGEGTGSGSGKGGVSFSLAGRRMVRTPQINDRSQETGKVVVDITVDKNGNVVSAIPGGRGSTTTSAYLNKLAREAAMKAKFNLSPEGADIQRGTISFVFLVQ
jgi:TonB family protein